MELPPVAAVRVRPSRPEVPESRARRRVVRAVAVTALLVSAAYLWWRVTATVEPATWWIAVPLLVLEIHAVSGLALFTFSLWDLDAAPTAAPCDHVPGPVAVLIPTYNEPAEVLLPTIAAAVALRPAHETWVLDDGDRPEIRRLAESLGASYMTRPDRRDAKAGNLNHALEHVDAEFVAVLDADHVASPELLRHTLGYFSDPEVAVVQTPQDFYNGESFEHVRTRRPWLRRRRAAYSEQQLFYRAIQPGKNRWGAAFWCGTGAVIRVRALQDVGGVATGSVTEDIQTTIRLQRAGWRAVYHNEVLARGLAAATVEQYALQRHRWCTGAMQVLRSERPFTGPGLSVRQRVAYAATLLGWFDAWRTLGYLVLPPLVLLTGASPIAAAWTRFLPAFAVTVVLQQTALWLLGRGYNRPVPSMIFELVRMGPTLRATTTLWRRTTPTFRVTPKGRTEGDRGRAPVPPILAGVLGVTVVSAVWYLATLGGHTPLTYGNPAVAHGAYAWLTLNGALTVVAVRRIRQQRYAGERRSSVRFPVNVPATIGGHGCELLDVSLTGGRVELPADSPFEGGRGPLDLRLDLHDGPAIYRCRIRAHWPSPGGGVRLGLEIVDAAPHEHARLALWAFGLADGTDLFERPRVREAGPLAHGLPSPVPPEPAADIRRDASRL